MRGLWVGEAFRSELLRKAAQFIPCVRCGAPPPSEMCHYFGPMRARLAGGLGYKCTDAAMAALCRRCHLHLDSYAHGNSTERSEEFLLLIVLTHHQLLSGGYLILAEQK